MAGTCSVVKLMLPGLCSCSYGLWLSLVQEDTEEGLSSIAIHFTLWLSYGMPINKETETMLYVRRIQLYYSSYYNICGLQFICMLPSCFVVG
ncbi:hypothetical protein VNO77_17965 [Canavalia gladiata]|uniref:Uncharacterized protein n=1 Tax=Canavalia gladiata TaxID=3824 RepID=A0AAN9LK00_CANGL